LRLVSGSGGRLRYKLYRERWWLNVVGDHEPPHVVDVLDRNIEAMALLYRFAISAASSPIDGTVNTIGHRYGTTSKAATSGCVAAD
jgi:hypothetical protein